LLGYGCGAINPYLAFETFDDMIRQGTITNVEYETACKNYIKAATKGVIKVASKIGISTIQSYRGAQIFEAIGLNKSVIKKYFTWTASRIEGADLEVLTQEALLRHQHAFAPRPGDIHTLDVGGEYQWRKDGEEHLLYAHLGFIRHPISPVLAVVGEPPCLGYGCWRVLPIHLKLLHTC
jgi:glutamate synthase (ferredoxin)